MGKSEKSDASKKVSGGTKSKNKNPRTLLDDMIMLYTFIASWQPDNSEILAERMDKVIAKLSEWPLEAIKSKQDISDRAEAAYKLMLDEWEKSEDKVVDMFRKCSGRLKEYFPHDQLEEVMNDLKEIMISPSERELEDLLAIAKNFDVAVNIPKSKTPAHKKVSSTAASAGDKSQGTNANKSKSNYQLIYKTNAVPCNGNMLSYIFSHKRLAQMGVIESDDDYKDDIDKVGTLNSDIVDAMTADINKTGKIPFLVFDDEDDENAWQSEVYLNDPSGDKSSIKEIYESLEYSIKRGPFFFGNNFIINSAFETSVIFTQDGFITFNPTEEGEWLLCPWIAFPGTQLVKKENSPEPIIHFMPGENDLGLASAENEENETVYHHQSVILLMKEIIDQFWECVEANRDSETQEIPMNKFRFITSENIGDYAVEILNKAGLKITRSVEESKETKTKSKGQMVQGAVDIDEKDKEGMTPYPGEFYIPGTLYEGRFTYMPFPKMVGKGTKYKAEDLFRRFSSDEVSKIVSKIKTEQRIPYLTFVSEILKVKMEIPGNKAPFWFIPFVIVGRKQGTMLYFFEDGIWNNRENPQELKQCCSSDMIQDVEVIEGHRTEFLMQPFNKHMSSPTVDEDTVSTMHISARDKDEE